MNLYLRIGFRLSFSYFPYLAVHVSVRPCGYTSVLVSELRIVLGLDFEPKHNPKAKHIDVKPKERIEFGRKKRKNRTRTVDTHGQARPCAAGRKVLQFSGGESLRKKGDWIVLIYALDTDYTTKSKIRALKSV